MLAPIRIDFVYRLSIISVRTKLLKDWRGRIKTEGHHRYVLNYRIVQIFEVTPLKING